MIPPVSLSHQTNKLINEKMDKLIASYIQKEWNLTKRNPVWRKGIEFGRKG
jgi:hypothetical protein